MTELFENAALGAEFSTCRRYRYRLWRVWNGEAPAMCFVGLNPSTADEREDDQTIIVLRARARVAGFGSLLVVNLFAMRSTDPAGLYGRMAPVSEVNDQHRNDEAILETAKISALVLCGWGNHGGLRGREVLARLRKEGITPFALAVNADGSPRHPLYVSYDTWPRPMP